MSHQPGDSRTLSFRSAQSEDLEWLVALRLQTMAPHLAEAGEKVSLEEQRGRVLSDFASIRIILVQGEQVGMVKVVRGETEWRLVQVQLIPRCQGTGIGTRIVGDLVEEAHAAGVPLSLSVLKVNPARRLYERLGFRITGESERSFEMRIDA